MKATGIVRRIDDLGRVVIPKEIRRTMRIREGDPLEIYTDREGEVIFKKYSPIGELASFAAEYAETLWRTCDLAIVITDRDAAIATAGVPRKEYAEKAVSEALDRIMEGRGMYVWQEGAEQILPVRDGGSAHVSCAMPILSDGDVVGCVVSLAVEGKSDRRSLTNHDAEGKLIKTAAGFLGKQLEN